MSESAGSNLELVDVEIADNVCSSDGCGVLLGRESNLENCTASGNRVVKSNEQMSSLLYAPASSAITIQGFSASRNNLAVVRVQDGVLSLSSASFDRNSFRKKHAGKTKTSCIHLVRSSAAISNCTFTANDGYRGSVILTTKSNVTLANISAINSHAVHDGGFMYAEDSNVTLENTSATNSHAVHDGGFMCAKYSHVTLANTSAINSQALHDGGFMYAEDSNVTLENTSATKSHAQQYGGFMYAEDSNVTLENTSATNSRAEYDGGFMRADDSNVTLENTSATNSHAQRFGGFMYAEDSNVKLENTSATNSRANVCGGFMYATDSIVTLENTSATNSSSLCGGFMDARNSKVNLLHGTTANNSAGYRGGFICSSRSTVTLEDVNVTNSSSERGGSIHAANSIQRISQSHWSSSTSSEAGGFVFAVDRSSIFINDTTFVQGKSRDGGAIWLNKSRVTAHKLSVANCEAQDGGGGVKGTDSSTFLCADCVFRDNTAKEGDGGGVFFDADREQSLALQLIRSSFANNVAKLGGKHFRGGMKPLLIFTSRRTRLPMQRE